MLVLFRLAVGLLAGALMLMFHLVAIALGCMVYVYFLPGVIAMRREYPGTNKVFVACAVAGWTVIGWIAALVFALTLPEIPVEHRLAANR